MKTELKFLNKKNGKKTLSLVLILSMIMMTSILAGCGQDTTGDDSASSGTDEISVQVVVTCEGILEVADTLDEELVRKAGDGTLIETTVTIPSGTNALDASMEAGTFDIDATGYVTTLEGIANGEAGPMSGWTYDVNSEAPTVGADEIEVKDGDVINWIYIVDFTAE